MRAKTLTLYSLPYIVGAASLVLAAHEVTPLLTTLRPSSVATPHVETFFGQSVNRALKGDRLPIRQTTPSDHSPKREPVPTPFEIAAR